MQKIEPVLLLAGEKKYSNLGNRKNNCQKMKTRTTSLALELQKDPMNTLGTSGDSRIRLKLHIKAPRTLISSAAPT